MYMKTKKKLKIKKVTFFKFLFESFSSFLPHPSNHPPFTHLHPSFPLYIFTLSNKEIKTKKVTKKSVQQFHWNLQSKMTRCSCKLQAPCSHEQAKF